MALSNVELPRHYDVIAPTAASLTVVWLKLGDCSIFSALARLMLLPWVVLTKCAYPRRSVQLRPRASIAKVITYVRHIETQAA